MSKITSQEKEKIKRLVKVDPIYCGIEKFDHWSPKLIRALFIQYLDIFHRVKFQSRYVPIKDKDVLSQMDKIRISMFVKGFPIIYLQYLELFNKFLLSKKKEKLFYFTCLDLRGGLIIMMTGPDLSIFEIGNDFTPPGDKIKSDIASYYPDLKSNEIIMVYKVS